MSTYITGTEISMLGHALQDPDLSSARSSSPPDADLEEEGSHKERPHLRPASVALYVPTAPLTLTLAPVPASVASTPQPFLCAGCRADESSRGFACGEFCLANSARLFLCAGCRADESSQGFACGEFCAVNSP
ncbi:hypothetical protein B0H17DRAFT_1200181 [Mycena rosella]|uniref:Uncharacterized protein n=1 Tax=Mycena rosella TaxID=1033263 RepID=A0AAD7G9P4_MYCRO|nr:hypothetical protein B0H17DRAFT_1208372 [Mycena rosella]KAJ7692850.1 hypothetical protein B0H17DRAFT_1200181 [Mycena rosella]